MLGCENLKIREGIETYLHVAENNQRIKLTQPVCGHEKTKELAGFWTTEETIHRFYRYYIKVVSTKSEKSHIKIGYPKTKPNKYQDFRKNSYRFNFADLQKRGEKRRNKKLQDFF